MLYAGIALGFLGSLLGVAISMAALVGALLGRAVGGALSPGMAGVALAISLLALAGTVNMRRHWRAAVLLDALCGALGLLMLAEYFIAPAVTLLMPALLYAAGELILRRRASGQVVRAAKEARDLYARTGELPETASADDDEQSLQDDCGGENVEAMMDDSFDDDMSFTDLPQEDVADGPAPLDFSAFGDEENAGDENAYGVPEIEAREDMPVAEQSMVEAAISVIGAERAAETPSVVEVRLNAEMNAARAEIDAAGEAMYAQDTMLNTPGASLAEQAQADMLRAQTAVPEEHDEHSDASAQHAEAPAETDSPAAHEPRVSAVSRGKRSRQYGLRRR